MRHGETVWNVEERVQGHRDSALTATGMKQARAYGERLKRENLTLNSVRFVSSPLGRARHTAEIILAGLGVDADRLELDARLAELNLGDWEGLIWQDVERDHGDALKRRQADRWNIRFPGGESFADIADRAQQWLDELDESLTVIAISHGAASRVIRGLYGRLDSTATMALPVPQDRIFRMSRGRIEDLLCQAD